MRKDFAEQFAAEGRRAAEALTRLRTHAVDALDLAVTEAPESSTRDRYRYAREHVLPLLMRIEDSGEQVAAVEDVAQALKLKACDLRNVRQIFR